MFSRKPKIYRNPVGDGVPDIPPTRSPPTPPRSAGTRRGGIPPQPGASLPPTPRRRTSPVGDGVPDVPQMKSKRRRWRRFHQFPRRVPHPDNSVARGPTSSQPVGVGVLDDPFLRPLRTSPRSAAPRRGGAPPPPGHGMTTGVRKSHELRAAGAARKGGTPGEGPPFDPLLRFVSIRRVPRAAARVQGLRPWTPPAFL